MWLILREQIESLYAQAEADENRVLIALWGTLRVLLDVWRQLVIDDALKATAALTYTTILAMVPVLAVSFAVLNAMVSSQEVAHAVREWMLNTLLADSVGEVIQTIEVFLDRAQDGSVGLVGFLFLLVTSVSLFLSVEQTFNNIWRAPVSRPIIRRLTTFYAVITLTPALLTLAFLAGRWMRAGLAELPFLINVGASVLPWLLEASALTLMYKLLPHTRVKWRAALIGGLFAALAIEACKWTFNSYIHSIYTGSVRSQIYGSFALIPVFFLWLYMLWLVILGGVELSYMAQNRHLITRDLLQRRGRRQSLLPPPPTGYLLTRIVHSIAGHFALKGGGITPDMIAGELQIPLIEIQAGIQLLVDGDVLLVVENADSEGEVVPGLPLDRIHLRALYALCDSKGYQPGELPQRPETHALEKCLSQAKLAADSILSTDIQSLLDE